MEVNLPTFKNEEERLAWLHDQINAKKQYRATAEDGTIHEYEHVHGLTHLVVIRDKNGAEIHNHCDSDYIAGRIVESALAEGKTAEIIKCEDVT